MIALSAALALVGALVGTLAVVAVWDLGRRYVATKRTPALLELREELYALAETHEQDTAKQLAEVRAIAEDARTAWRNDTLVKMGGRR